MQNRKKCLLLKVTYLCSRVGSGRGNTAVVVAVLGHPDVTLLSPDGVPGVLHDPVVARGGRIIIITSIIISPGIIITSIIITGIIIITPWVLIIITGIIISSFIIITPQQQFAASGGRGSITDNGYTVVELGGRASGFVVDTAGVHLERWVGSINGDRDGSSGGGGSLESAFVTLGDSSDITTNVGFVKVALTILSSVRIGILSVKTTSRDNVLECIIHKTTVATHVSIGARAVNKLLLSKRSELAALGEVGTFGGSDSTESPAGSALTLILNGGHVSLGSPVNGGRVVLEFLLDGVLGLINSDGGSQVSLPFLTVQVSKLVGTEFERHLAGLGQLVVGVDQFHVVTESGVLGVELVGGGVVLAVSLHPVHEVLLLGLQVGALGNGSKAHKGVENCGGFHC